MIPHPSFGNEGSPSSFRDRLIDFLTHLRRGVKERKEGKESEREKDSFFSGVFALPFFSFLSLTNGKIQIVTTYKKKEKTEGKRRFFFFRRND